MIEPVVQTARMPVSADIRAARVSDGQLSMLVRTNSRNVRTIGSRARPRR